MCHLTCFSEQSIAVKEKIAYFLTKQLIPAFGDLREKEKTYAPYNILPVFPNSEQLKEVSLWLGSILLLCIAFCYFNKKLVSSKKKKTLHLLIPSCLF